LDFDQFALVFVLILDKNDKQKVKDSLKFTIGWEGFIFSRDVGGLGQNSTVASLFGSRSAV